MTNEKISVRPETAKDVAAACIKVNRRIYDESDGEGPEVLSARMLTAMAIEIDHYANQVRIAALDAAAERIRRFGDSETAAQSVEALR